MSVLPASCRHNETMRDRTICRQGAGSTLGGTFTPPLNRHWRRHYIRIRTWLKRRFWRPIGSGTSGNCPRRRPTTSGRRSPTHHLWRSSANNTGSEAGAPGQCQDAPDRLPVGKILRSAAARITAATFRNRESPGFPTASPARRRFQKTNSGGELISRGRRIAANISRRPLNLLARVRSSSGARR